MTDILTYITERYHPETILLYGSFADGSNNAHSDFDALVMAEGAEQSHDASVVAGTQLDLFVYPSAYFDQPYDCEDFVQVFDGRIALDTHGRGAALKQAVNDYLDAMPKKTAAENRAAVEWCEKMLLRMERGDAEGFFRGHWLLVDSLEIYCDERGKRYLGPKKALRQLAQDDPEAAEVYGRALASFAPQEIAAWVRLLRTRLEVTTGGKG